MLPIIEQIDPHRPKESTDFQRALQTDFTMHPSIPKAALILHSLLTMLTILTPTRSMPHFLNATALAASQPSIESRGVILIRDNLSDWRPRYTSYPQHRTSVPGCRFPPLQLAPPHKDKNCKGSTYCFWTANSCRIAASLFEDDLVYTKPTAYVTSLGGLFDIQTCRASYDCPNGAFGAGLTGLEIKSAFARLWTPFPGYGNETCRFCGTAVLSTGCWVNANYCDTDKANCKNENTEAALALDPGDGRALGVGDSGPWNGSRSELTVHGWNTCKARFA